MPMWLWGEICTSTRMANCINEDIITMLSLIKSVKIGFKTLYKEHSLTHQKLIGNHLI